MLYLDLYFSHMFHKATKNTKTLKYEKYFIIQIFIFIINYSWVKQYKKCEKIFNIFYALKFQILYLKFVKRTESYTFKQFKLHKYI